MLFISIKTTTRWSWFRKVVYVEDLAICDESGKVVLDKSDLQNQGITKQWLKDFLRGKNVMLCNGWNSYFDGFEMQWFPQEEIPFSGVFGCNELVRVMATAYQHNRRLKLDHYMRAIVGFKSSHLIGLINARCADFIKQYNDHILSTASMEFDPNGNVVVAFNRQQYEFMMGFGRGQSEEHVEFCKNATKGLVDQLLAIP